ncbi:hypothetical protein [Paludibaculum fermentans]|uniref:hypothetical protein n=1 Tax=Paludibaculum fermentans TaxID=1473598 RepID=UPI003EB9E8B2
MSLPTILTDSNPGAIRPARTAASCVLLFLALLSTVGCSKKMAVIAPPAPDVSIVGSDSDRLQESLFKGDQAVLSNQDIDRILTARITLSDRHRVAVLHLNSRNTYYQEIADLEGQNSEQFLKALASTPQFTQVRFIPTLLIPDKRTAPYLREAAARFQADLLLIYATRVRNFQRDRLLGTDEVHAEAAVESVLLDVRTGIVIHSAHSSEGIAARKVPGDLNFSQTVSKAQAEATGKALLKIATAVGEFASHSDK